MQLIEQPVPVALAFGVVSYHPALGNPGDFFYHYTTRETAFQHIVPEGRLRLSPAFRMRDPLESNPALLPTEYGVTGDDPEVEHARQVTGMEAGLRLHELRRCSKVLSLTIDARGYDGDAEVFGRGYARARMWEHYAENHQGICLMLRRDGFRARALAELRNRSPNAWADAVSYTQSGILEDAAATLLPSPGMSGADVTQEHIRTHLTAIFFTKLMDWQSEHEYRFVESSTDDTYTFVDIGDTLAGIIVGEKFPDWQMPGLFAMCDRVGAQAWRMSWELSRPWPQLISQVPAS